MDELVFTPSAVLDLLLQIDELKEKAISLSELPNGDIQLEIDDSVYTINKDDAEDVEAPEDVVEDISNANTEAYETLESSGEVTLSEPVTSGLLKEAVKSLAVGGMVRLAGKLMK